jgi:amino-acid N-acetyltransferase
MTNDRRPSSEVALRAPDRADLACVRQLLAAESLPDAGLEATFGPGFVLAVGKDGGLVGVAGIETYGAHGLLRSVAVMPSWRGTGIGTALVHNRLDWARAQGLTSVHLLTTTAERYFHRLGFATVAREALPAPIQTSVEFRSACPDTAVPMSLPLAASSPD